MGINAEKEIWYLARDGKRHGPITDSEMRKLMELGHLKGDDLVWRPGYQDWRKAITVFSTFKLNHKIERKPTQRSGNSYQNSDQTNSRHRKAAEELKKIIDAESSQLLRRDKPPSPKGLKPKEQLPKSLVVEQALEEPFEDQISNEFGEDQENPPHLETASKGSLKKILYAGASLGAFGAFIAAYFIYSSQIKIGLEIFQKVQNSKTEDLSRKPFRSQNKLDLTGAIERKKSLKENNVEDKVIQVDSNLQKSSLWILLKKEFPEWYQIQLDEIKRLIAELNSEPEINAKLSEALVALRRQKARMGLAAGTDQFKKIASTFISHLASLEKRSVDDCYSYISKGEMTPYAISVTQNPIEGETLHAHMEEVMRAIVEGEKTPSFHNQPQKGDYDLLAKELRILGWSEADIQFFADPQTLSQAPPAQVCKMVREWFVAHLAITDSSARERLLYETLRPIIAG